MPNPNARSAADIEAELAGINDNTQDLDFVDPDNTGGAEDNRQQTSAAESEAGRKGWVPKDQYKKDPATWVDAKTFLERGDRFVGNLQREVDALKQKLSDFEGTKAQFIKFSNEQLELKDRQLNEAITALRVQKSQATADGEHQTAIEIEDRIDLLKDQKKELKAAPAEVAAERKPGPDPADPVLLEWIEDGNQWFKDDPKLMAYAVAMGETMIKEGETVRGRRFLDKVAARMAEEFPRRFAKQDNASGNRQSAGESGSQAPGNRSGANGGRTERDLPPEDLALMKQFIADGYTTKEKFLKSYWERNA